ncbi:MAG: hypothetical protein DWG76_00420 [Chloroflexi bacterium]|nr:hypothetical protein [Chloroflexota bacterium]
MNAISLITAVIALLFAGGVFERYRQRGGAHLLAWSVGALLYGAAALGAALLSLDFSETALKAWYLGGAMLAAPWLGQGTVFLLVRKRGVAGTLAAGLLLLSLLAFELLRAAPIAGGGAYNAAIPPDEQYRVFLVRNGLIIALTIILNLYGTITLAGGAIYSAYLFWRKQVLQQRVVGNVLIAAGALLPASGGASVLAGVADWHSLSLLLGVILLYAGYVVATRPPSEKS